MSELGHLLRLFEVGRMGRRDLERLVDELDGEGHGGMSLDELEPMARAASVVDSVERLMGRAARRNGRGGGRGSRGRAVTIDMDEYERSKAYLAKLGEERAEREELREAARGRLRHFEKRDGYLYRPVASTPLERYQAALISARDAQEAKA